MYAPIFGSLYSQSKFWHRVNENAPTRAACNPHAILDHERSQADLPEGAVLCKHCARRTPYTLAQEKGPLRLSSEPKLEAPLGASSYRRQEGRRISEGPKDPKQTR